MDVDSLCQRRPVSSEWFFLDITGCLEGGKWHQIDARDVFGVDVAILLIA